MMSKSVGAQRLVVALDDAAGHELLPLGGDEGPDLLAAGLAQVVGLLQRVAGELLRHPHDGLLVEHQPVGVLQNRLEVRVEVGQLLAPVLQLGVVPVHVGRHGAGPVQGHQRSHIVEAGRRQGAQGLAHRRALELEHPDRVGPAQHLEGGLIGQVDPVDVQPHPGAGFHQVQRPLDHREVAQPEEVHLEQPELFDPVHLVLGHDGRVLGFAPGVGLALDGQVVGQRVARDDHGGGVDPVLAPQAFQPEGDVDDLLGVGVGLVHGAQLGRCGVALLVAVGLGEAGVERRVTPHDQRRHGLGDAVADDVGLAEDACRRRARRPAP